MVVFSTETPEVGTILSTIRCSAFRLTPGLWMGPIVWAREWGEISCIQAGAGRLEVGF